MHHERRLVHVEQLPIRWGDMDAMMHVNNTVYFRYMEQARIGWYEQHCGALSGMQDEGFVIANAACNFRIPLTYPGTVEVKMFLGPPGRASVESHYEMWMNGKLHADGSAKIVWIDVTLGKSKPLPPRIVAACAPRA